MKKEIKDSLAVYGKALYKIWLEVENEDIEKMPLDIIRQFIKKGKEDE